jgi:uncharacterized protein YkwD
MSATPRTARKIRNALLAWLVAKAVLLTALVANATSASAMTTTEQSFATAMLKLLNSERAVYHLAPLTVSTRLVSSARSHDLYMAKYNTMSHQLPGESSFGTRITRTGYHWTRIGENIGWNSSITSTGILYLEKVMYGEKAPNDGHRLNILNKYYKNIGIDVYIDNVHHKVWFTQDMGTPA